MDTKAPVDTKAPADAKTTTAAPGKFGEVKKPAEPPKTPTEGKGIAASGTDDKSSVQLVQDVDVTQFKPRGLFPIDKKDPIFIKLVESIRKDGLKEPIRANKLPDGSYEVIDGDRRLAAVKEIGTKVIRAVVFNLPEKLSTKAAVQSNRLPPDYESVPDTKDVVTPPDKTGGIKKPEDIPKASPDAKATPTVPGKPDEVKKPAEPPKAPTDAKDAGVEKAATDEDIPKTMRVPVAPEDGKESVELGQVSEIHAFDGHPYNVNDDKDMWELVESVKRSGVIEPVMVIRDEKKGGYELISGHRRHRASQLAELTSIPMIVRNIDRDTAIIAMVDANLRRETISPMEKARAYSMKMEALKRKAGRPTREETLAGKVPKRADEIIGEQMGESRATVQRTARLVNLVPELQTLVDKKELPVNTGAEISYLKPAEQKKLADSIEKEGGKVPSGAKATELKKDSQEGKLTTEKIEKAVAPTKQEVNPPLKVTFNEEELRDYFPDKKATVGTVKRAMFEALDLRKRALDRQAAKAKEVKPKKPEMAR